MDIKEAKLAAAFFGREGGKKTVEKYGMKHFSNAGKIGMAKRWAGHVKVSGRKRAKNTPQTDFPKSSE